MTDEKKPNPFNIIRYRGEPQKAEFEGVPIRRQARLFIAEWGMFVPCAPYDDHFVFEIPVSRKRVGMSDYMCTCGSAAVVANPEKPGRLFVCHFHALHNHHVTSELNISDFERTDLSNYQGRNPRKWLI